MLHKMNARHLVLIVVLFSLPVGCKKDVKTEPESKNLPKPLGLVLEGMIQGEVLRQKLSRPIGVILAVLSLLSNTGFRRLVAMSLLRRRRRRNPPQNLGVLWRAGRRKFFCRILTARRGKPVERIAGDYCWLHCQ